MNSKGYAFAVLWLILVSGTVSAGDPIDLSPTLEEIRAKGEVPGMVAIGLKDGEIAVVAEAGRRRVDDPTPARIEDRWHLGSCGKAMTSTMVATLVEEGSLEWTSTVGEILEDMRDAIHPGFHDVTIRQLLQHQGGIAERRNPALGGLLAQQLAFLEGEPQQQRWDAVSIVLKEAPTATVGGGAEYSNYGYMTAAVMAEFLADQSWRELMIERIFLPLGMEEYGFCLPGTQGEVDHPRGHVREGDTWKFQEPGVDRDLPECIAPAGLIHCSMLDWAKFIQLHIDGARGDDGGILEASTIQALHQPPEGSTYACGWAVSSAPWAKGTVFGHNGSNGAWLSLATVAPELNAAVLTVSNAVPEGGQARLEAITDAVFQAMGITRTPATND